MKRLFHILLSAALLIIPAMCFSPVVSAEDAPLEEHSLTIEYLNEDGSQAFPTYSARITEGEEYSIESPQLEESSPDPETVEGVMGSEDVSEIVTYASYTLTYTIYYVFEDGSQAAPPVSKSFRVSSRNETVQFSVPSPAVSGYTPSQSLFSTSTSLVWGNSQSATITYYPNNLLKIEYVYSNGSEAAPSVAKTLKKGDTFSITSPSVKGYTPDKAVISGTMGSSPLIYKVVYNLNTYTLTIKYIYPDGTEASPTVTKKVGYNAGYNVKSPTVAGFVPDLAQVSGTMGEKDISFTVTYTRDSYPLTVTYQYKDGSQAAASVTQNIKPGTTYRVNSPSIVGYVPDIPIVSGTMPENEVSVTVTYSPKISNLVIDYLYPDGSEASPMVTKPFEYNQPYNISSPSVPNCTPDIPTVSGVMGTEDIHITVTYTKNDCRLTIKYQYKNGVSASGTYSKSYKPGDNYSIKSPSIKGYTADKAEVSGEMPPNDLTVTVIYSPIPYTLTIRYIFEDGGQAAPPYTSSIGYNNTFSIPSPSVPGFAPDRSIVSGKMGNADATFTVTYTEPRYLLTVRYSSQNRVSRSNGMKIAPDYTGRFKEGEKYEVPSPLIIGYETELSSVSGVMPAHDVIETVSYRLAGEPVMGDTSKLLNVISSSGEYIQVYVSKTLLALVTAGLILFAAIMVVKAILYVINYFTKS